MVYEFSSRATAPVIMMARDAETLLRIVGKSPQAHGIIENNDLPRAIDQLKAAIALEGADEFDEPVAGYDTPGEAMEDGPVSLRQRAWPVIEMMERADAGGQPVVWSQETKGSTTA